MVNSVSSSGSWNKASTYEMRLERFNKMDANSDGSIDKKEMAAGSSKKSGTIDDIFTNLDSNSDGLLSLQESEAGFAKMAQQMKDNPPPPPPMKMGETGGVDNAGGAGQADDIFSKLDANGDGSITKDELTTAMTSMGQSDTDISKIFSEVDADADGAISKSESDAFEAKKKADIQNGNPVSNLYSQIQGWQVTMMQELWGTSVDATC